MDKKKFESLLQDEKFIEVMGGAKTTEEVQKIFKENGVDISIEEVEKLARDGRETLDDFVLEEVTGGGKTHQQKVTEYMNARNLSIHARNECELPPITYDEAEKELAELHKNQIIGGVGWAIVAGGLMAAGAGIKTLVDKHRKKHS